MDQWAIAGVAFGAGWCVRPLLEVREVRVAPCTCHCGCECISKDNNSLFGSLAVCLCVILLITGASLAYWKLVDKPVAEVQRASGDPRVNF